MTTWVLVAILHMGSERYVATRVFPLEETCRAIAMEVRKLRENVETVCVKPIQATEAR
jgi:hypothetical protein